MFDVTSLGELLIDFTQEFGIKVCKSANHATLIGYNVN